MRHLDFARCERGGDRRSDARSTAKDQLAQALAGFRRRWVRPSRVSCVERHTRR